MENELAMAYGSQNPVTDELAAQGRKGDAMMAHVTPGDYVIPKDILVQHPDFLVKLKKVMSDENEDYRTHMVGSGFENINPTTGAAEFGFGKSYKNFTRATLGKPLAQIGNLGGEAVRGIPGVGTFYDKLGGGIAKVADVIPGQKQVLGSEGYFGSLSSGASGQPGYYDKSKGDGGGGSAEAPYSPTEMKLPGSMQELSGLTDEQRRAYLATQGSQGEGLGGSSRDYYANLLQRNIQQNKGNLLPVESQYLGSQGINTGLSGQALIDALRGF